MKTKKALTYSHSNFPWYTVTIQETVTGHYVYKVESSQFYYKTAQKFNSLSAAQKDANRVIEVRESIYYHELLSCLA